MIALLLGIVVARFYTRPLHELTAAVQKMRQGDLEQQVPVRSRDEIGVLAAQFNQMSADLAHVSKLRRQMTADIAHDLRTPLTVIAGYLESLRDGILKPNPERFETMYAEAMLLQRLVEDLRTLSLADAGELHLNRQAVTPIELLRRTAQSYQSQAEQLEIRLGVDASSALPRILVDPERMGQVLGNLVSNALRYVPPQNGYIKLSAVAAHDVVQLAVEDNGAGIDPAHLPNIFERFYRADEARDLNTGESGLGLAIAKSIVEAHGGTIAVESQVNAGTRFTLLFPVNG